MRISHFHVWKDGHAIGEMQEETVQLLSCHAAERTSWTRRRDLLRDCGDEDINKNASYIPYEAVGY